MPRQVPRRNEGPHGVAHRRVAVRAWDVDHHGHQHAAVGRRLDGGGVRVEQQQRVEPVVPAVEGHRGDAVELLFETEGRAELAGFRQEAAKSPGMFRYLSRDHLVPGADLLALEGDVERETGLKDALEHKLLEEARSLVCMARGMRD